MKTVRHVSIIYLLFLFLSSNSQLFSQTLYVNKLSDLVFGDVFFGYSALVLDTDPGAAKFSFYHSDTKRKNIRVNFNLPTTLTNGLDNIPITFDQGYTSYSLNDQISGRTNFNPFKQLSIKKIEPFETVYVWIGGTIDPITGLSGGLYTGTIIITVAY